MTATKATREAANRTATRSPNGQAAAYPVGRKKPTFNNPTGTVSELGQTVRSKDANTWWQAGGLGSSIPLPPTNYVQTRSAKLVQLAVNHAVRTGHITLVDGEFGVGKTTAVVEAARAQPTVDAIYVNMFGVTSPRDALAIIYRALTGEDLRKRVTAAQLREDLTEHLKDRPVLIIADDAHRLRTPSLETLLALWNRVHNDTRKGVSMVFVGNNLVKHLGAAIPELVSRSALAISVDRLGSEGLVEFIEQLAPGIAGTDPQLLNEYNPRFLGQVRNWVQFFDTVAYLRGEATLTSPISSQEARKAYSLMAQVVASTPSKGQHR